MIETIPPSLDGERVDRVVAVLTDLPRSVVASLVERGAITIDGRAVSKPSFKVADGQTLEVEMPTEDDNAPEPQADIDFTVIYEDEHVIVVDKPEGLVVHPGAGNPDGTLVNGLLARFVDMAQTRPGDPMRPGIVHRLDAGTSGLLVVARTQVAYEALVDAMKERDVGRRYLTLVWGDVQPDRGMIEAPIGRAEANRLKMTVSAKGKSARTRYEVMARHDDPVLSLVNAELETGRTHQIRVHFAAIDHPVVGDGRYGGVRSGLKMSRPFLHAQQLRFDHPVTGVPLQFESPLPSDLEGVLRKLGLEAR